VLRKSTGNYRMLGQDGRFADGIAFGSAGARGAERNSGPPMTK
jgi:hypothetical protein